MKTLIKILSIAIIIFACLFIIAYLFFAARGKDIIAKQIESLTYKKVNIDSVNLRLPLALEIRKLNISGLFEADDILVSPSVIGLFSGNIALNNLKLTRPKLTYVKNQPQTSGTSSDTAISPIDTTIPHTPQLKAGFKLESKAEYKKKRPFRLIFKHVDIKDGTLDFIDHTVGGNGIKITVKDIDLNLTNLYVYPRSAITNFALKGKIPWQQGKYEGKIEADGWLNLFKRDMQATLKIEDIDGLYLYPYYSQWVNLEKARVERTKLNLVSNIHSLNNELTAECHLELTDIEFRPRADDESMDKAEKIAAAVMDVLKSLNKGKIILNFTIRTKMINPQFNMSEVKDAFEQRLAEGLKNNQVSAADVFSIPTKVVVGTVKGATDVSKALIDGTFSIAKGLKQAVEYAFKRELNQE